MVTNKTNLPVDTGRKTGVWQKAGWWFWTVILLGLAIRIYLVIFTEGTYDAAIKYKHASVILDLGLTVYYHANA
jgi:hypothetical protein